MRVNGSDPRAPYIAYAGAKSVSYDLRGLRFRDNSLADGARFPLFNLPAGTLVNTLVGSTVVPANTAPLFFDLNVLIHNRSSKSIRNSEFGARYSWLLPIGNGLQMSFIYLYVARFGKLQFDPSHNHSAPFYLVSHVAIAVYLTPDACD